MQGLHVSGMRERKHHWRNAQSKRGKHNSVGVPKALGPRELSGEVAACKARQADMSWLGWLGQTQERFLMEKLILNFNWIQILARLWEILQGDLEGIWTWGFFLNYSMLLKDLWKNKICHAMNATLGQIKLRNPFP
jgi:hypothetical protein